MIAAIVLAAGRSDRMGRPKALLPLGSTTFLETILKTLAASRVTAIRVVLGHGEGEIRRRVSLPDEIVVTNHDHQSGMLSSVRCGIRALPAGHTGLLLWPVDHPLVRTTTLGALIGAFEAGGPPLVVPVHQGRRGHPALFSSSLVPELMAAPDSIGAKHVVHTHAIDRLDFPVDDAGVVSGIDTPEAYERALGTRLPP